MRLIRHEKTSKSRVAYRRLSLGRPFKAGNSEHKRCSSRSDD